MEQDEKKIEIQAESNPTVDFFDDASGSISSSDQESCLEKTDEHRHHHSHSHRHSSHSHRHHSHRHHHHSTSHSRNHKRSNKNNKFASFLKRNKNAIIIMFLCFVVAFLLVLLAITYDRLKKANETRFESSGVVSSGSARIDVSFFAEDVSLINKPVSVYINDVGNKSVHDLWRDNKGNVQRLDVGLPVRLSYNVGGLPSGVSVEQTVLEISEDEDFNISRSFFFEEKSNVVDVYHLKTGVRYYYRVVAKTSNDKTLCACGDFVTKASPRLMKIDGAVNVRDIGGWTTIDGKVIRQGLLYRGSEIDGAVEPKYCITEKGKNDMLSVLGIRSEVDLRSRELTPDGRDVLGENIEHIYYGISMYSEVLDDHTNDEKIRSLFSYLADVDNYPVYMHCTYGRDRTGTVCYLLEALLGLSDINLEKEYELTAFYDGYTNVKEFTKFVGEVEDIEGATTQEKVENYLLSIGVTAEEIESIRNIFLEEEK